MLPQLFHFYHSHKIIIFGYQNIFCPFTITVPFREHPATIFKPDPQLVSAQNFLYRPALEEGPKTGVVLGVSTSEL